MSRSLAVIFVLFAATLCLTPTESFTVSVAVSKPTTKAVFAKKEDLSFIESRDMTREEMKALNQKNEDIMNMELQAMTAFSLIISLPILYLCWVAFFSE
eukprot:CAMPEP_0116545520 /NCGR_PEP_ID=MMETSP0397-20121206/2715_1 /TAXON_ID=216820 /ORGANISM="Cyclophora tenuis, Strain ECT3854" /LENGTH=98 /DNA_ID=CAMNT_0004069845 /DNA_START=13 /DNA_END=309 /DNA_ORIENTATION=+